MKLTLLFSYLLIIFTNSDSDQDKDKNDTLKTYYFAATTVTATRIKQPIKDVALTTIVIDRNQIDKTLPVDVPEAIRQYPGIDIFHYGGPGALSSISIRGVMSNGILVLKDGRPVNSILTGNCDLSSLNLNEIERIEIVKGPTSSFYGANGLGGVVNFISEKEIKGLEISLKNRLGLYSFQENYIDLNIPINKLTTRLSGNLITSDGIRSNSDYLNKYISGHIKYANPKIDLNSIFSYNWRDLGVPGPKPYKNSIPLFGDSTASSLFDREKDKIWMATVRGEFR
ncbi:MAG: TonB-dependent receptor plug domain-containing protein, partial [candidate division WOR-3 bacterium]